MEKIVAQGQLYDFYGELLTDHQKKVYEDFVYNDLSLSEIAEEYQISRQGVHDLIKRCDRIMQNYEDKLRLIKRFVNIQAIAGQFGQLADSAAPIPEELRQGVRQLTDELLREIL